MGWFSRNGPSGFSASSTAEDVTDGIDGTNLTAIVTGASRGIGLETTRVLALRGVHVIMGVRNLAAGRDVKEAIVNEIPAAKVDVLELDLSSMTSVRKFAAEFMSLGLPLNILINNAGIIRYKEPIIVSQDNVELTFATNHLGHFLLTNLVLETMKSSARQSNVEGRIINVSSVAHTYSYPEGIRFGKINNPSSGNLDGREYCHSKLANILHANELARRLKEDGVQITANSLHPGLIHTDIWQSNMLILNVIYSVLGRFVVNNVQQGASTTCYVALHPNVKGISGQYFAKNNISKASTQSENRELAKELWDFSMSLIS